MLVYSTSAIILQPAVNPHTQLYIIWTFLFLLRKLFITFYYYGTISKWNNTKEQYGCVLLPLFASLCAGNWTGGSTFKGARAIDASRQMVLLQAERLIIISRYEREWGWFGWVGGGWRWQTGNQFAPFYFSPEIWLENPFRISLIRAERIHCGCIMQSLAETAPPFVGRGVK